MKLNIQLFAEDGWLTLGTKLDTKQFDKDIVELYDKIQENSEEQIEIKADIKENEKVLKTITEMRENLENMIIDSEQVGEILSQTLSEEAMQPLEQFTNYFTDSEKTAELLDEYISKINSNIEQGKDNLLNSKLQAMRLKEELKEVKNQGDGFKKFTANASKGFVNLVKSVAKWGLALLSIRSIYGLLSNAASHLQKTNKQTYENLQYIKFALATALEPVITRLVDWAMKLMSYVAIILYKLTGVNIFSKATAENFKKASKNAKDMKNTIAGFDEITKVSDNGASGVTGPSVDLSKVVDDEKLNTNLEEAETKVMSWSERLQKFWTKNWTSAFDEINDYLFGGILPNLTTGIGLFCKGIYDILVGLGEMIIGIVDMLIGLFTGDMEKVKEGFKIFCKGLLDIVLGLGELLGGAILAIVGTIVDLIVAGAKLAWTGIKAIWEPVKNFFVGIGTSIGNAISSAWTSMKDGAKKAWEGIKSIFSSVGSFFSNTFKSAWEKVKNIFSTGGKIFDGIKDGIASAFKTIVNKLIDGINKVVKLPFEKINSMLNSIHDIEILGIEPFKKLWSKNPLSIPQIPKLAKGGIINNPGRGVAIGGEAGREGVIPLTDAQQMEILGEAIGKYITINLTNNTNLDGRTIARQTNKINSNKNFAMNR